MMRFLPKTAPEGCRHRAPICRRASFPLVDVARSQAFSSGTGITKRDSSTRASGVTCGESTTAFTTSNFPRIGAATGCHRQRVLTPCLSAVYLVCRSAKAAQTKEYRFYPLNFLPHPPYELPVGRPSVTRCLEVSRGSSACRPLRDELIKRHRHPVTFSRNLSAPEAAPVQPTAQRTGPAGIRRAVSGSDKNGRRAEIASITCFMARGEKIPFYIQPLPFMPREL